MPSSRAFNAANNPPGPAPIICTVFPLNGFGSITFNLGANTVSLLGNPYASNIDADEFIKDNIIFVYCIEMDQGTL